MQDIIAPDILYEDNHIIAVNKKPSQIVQEDSSGDISMDNMLKMFIKRRDSKPGNVYIGVVHRLDRPVGGVIIFAKTEKSLVRLNEMFRKGEISKTYLAIVKKAPPKESDTLTNYLYRNKKQNKSYVYDIPRKDTKPARLEYVTAGRSDSYTLLSIRLFTGRHHQIRAQLAAIGSPIKGDLKYGFDRSNPDASISLFARSISFIHPVKQTFVEIIAPVPQTDVWQFFSHLSEL
ncbi:MAG: RluA family pseudouridine synthase [Prevotellaceae bacterium]|jgi:23S rRNA pseudouridine1911/1915/1917 synthase|nr:RluA family pseudouridine synthase [Prevotellaceae bacterium]